MGNVDFVCQRNGDSAVLCQVSVIVKKSIFPDIISLLIDIEDIRVPDDS